MEDYNSGKHSPASASYTASPTSLPQPTKPKASYGLLEKYEEPKRLQPSQTLLGQATAPQIADSQAKITQQRKSGRDDHHKQQVAARNTPTAPFLPLLPEDMALLADGSTAKWTKEVSITAVNPSGRSYEVQDSPSLTYTSGRELLKKESNAPTQNHPSFLNSRINKKKKKMQQCNYPEVHELDAR